jgi:hypothetical protein
MFAKGPSNLHCGKHQPSWRMKHQIDWDARIGHANGAEDILGIIDVDIADDREPQPSHRFPPVNHYDHSRAALSLEARDLALAGGLEDALLQVRLNGGEDAMLSPAPDG